MSIETLQPVNQDGNPKKTTLEIVTETAGGKPIAYALANTRLASYLIPECDQWKSPEILAAVVGILRLLEQNGFEIRRTDEQ